MLVDVFLVESDQRFGDALADGVDLRHVASTFDADAHVDTGEAVAAEEENRLIGLVAEDFRLDELDRGAINLDQAAAALAVGSEISPSRSRSAISPSRDEERRRKRERGEEEREKRGEERKISPSSCYARARAGEQGEEETSPERPGGREREGGWERERERGRPGGRPGERERERERERET